jgi:hypothetical protein
MRWWWSDAIPTRRWSMRRGRNAGTAGEVGSHFEYPVNGPFDNRLCGEDGLEALPARASCEKRRGARLSNDCCKTSTHQNMEMGWTSVCSGEQNHLHCRVDVFVDLWYALRSAGTHTTSPMIWVWKQGYWGAGRPFRRRADGFPRLFQTRAIVFVRGSSWDGREGGRSRTGGM